MTGEFRHSFVINYDRCRGSMNCMRACPAQALRVRDGKVLHISEMCIDCGGCVNICPGNTFTVKVDSLDSIRGYDRVVAMPSPTIFGQFSADVPQSAVIRGLKQIGFDEVYDSRIEFELVTKAIADYIDEHRGPWPLISNNCPVVVRLIQVMYPHMVDQIIPVDTPREIIAREFKRTATEKHGIDPTKVAAVYMAPCPAKATAVKSPAEGAKSYIDYVLSIADIFNNLQRAIEKNNHGNSPDNRHDNDSWLSKTQIGWVLTGGQSRLLQQTSYISVARLENVIHVLDAIDMGKINGIKFLEGYACTGGCVGGSLTVRNTYVAQTKLRIIASELPDNNPEISTETEKRYVKGDYFIRNPLKPRPVGSIVLDMSERIRRMKLSEEIRKKLPGIDCGICGSPTCKVFSEDVAAGEVNIESCFLISDEIIGRLRRIYKPH